MAQEDFVRTLEAVGASSEEIKQALAVRCATEEQDPDKMPEVQPANFMIVQLFFQVCHYWERVGMEATPVCLDPLKVEARASKLRWYQQLDEIAMELLWQGLDIMANACLMAWADQRENASNIE